MPDMGNSETRKDTRVDPEQKREAVDPIAQAAQTILAEAQAASLLAQQNKETIEAGRKGLSNFGKRRRLGFTKADLETATAAVTSAEAHAALVSEVVTGNYRYTGSLRATYDETVLDFTITGMQNGQKVILEGWGERQHSSGPGYGPGAHFRDIQRYSRTVGTGKPEIGRNIDRQVKAVRGVVNNIYRRAGIMR